MTQWPLNLDSRTMFWRKRKKSPAELANEAEIDKLAREATVEELERGFGDRPPSLFHRGMRSQEGTWQEGGDLKLPDDKPYDGDAEPTSP